MKMDRKTIATNNTTDNFVNKPGDRQTDPENSEPLLPKGSEMSARIQAFDWSKTPLGPISTWSPALLTLTRIMLANRFPHLLWWGPDYITLYNDPYIPALGKKHPLALGQTGSECWEDIWHIIQPLVDTPFKGGPATWNDDIFLELNRYGFVEETHFTIAYSPVPDETAPGGIGGVLATVHEITEKVIGERRIVTLRDLGARVGEARSAEEACHMAAETLGRHNKDIPFTLLYLVDADGRQARLAGAAGVAVGEAISPELVELSETTETGWPLAAVQQMETLQVVEHLGERYPSVPPGPWSDPPHTAVVVSIPSNKVHEPAGLLVAGISPRLTFDQLYRDFIGLVRTQIAAAIANARVYEEERRRAEALAEIDRAKIAFFSNISHEFRTPLTLMMGPLEDALADGDELSTANRERLELAHRNAVRQLKLVNTLLEFSRIEAGRVQANYEPLDLGAFTMELASSFRSAIEHAGLKFSVDCPPLPEPVYVDREMWEKIVLNLLSNAFKFTFEGEIEVSLRPAEDSAVLQVRDSGVGIPAGETENIFKRFHRVRDVRSRTFEGTGIGLALVQELVHLHGGQIQVTSIEGQGSTFTISIPTGKAHLPSDRIGMGRTLPSTATGPDPYIQEALSWLADNPRVDLLSDPWPANIERALNTEPKTAPPAQTYRILLADDNADMRRYLERLLSQNQYEVELAADGLAALQAVRERAPDLLLLDVMMPKLDGFALLRELRSDEATASIPVIIISARAGEEARAVGMDAGADDYLIKPFSARELLTRVRARLEITRIRTEAERTIRYRSAQYQTLLNQAPLGVYLVDADFRIREVNPSARPTFGDIPHLIGRDFDEVIHILWEEEYADEVVRLFRHTLETGEPYETPERVKYRIDRHVTEFYKWRLDRIVLPDGRFGVVCYFRDISSEVRARARIAASEERYRSIVNQSIGGIAETDTSGRFVTVNDRFCEITGYTREELLVGTMMDITHPDDLPRNLALFQELASGGPTFEIVKRYIRKEGTPVWVHNNVSAIRDENGRIRSLIAISIDITKSKQAKEDLEQLNLHLESLVQVRTSELQSVNQSLREEIHERIRAERKLNLSRDRLRQLSRRLMEVQEEERRAIARELHDRVGQGLTALNLNLTIIRDQLSERDADRLGGRLDDSIHLLENTIPAVRDLMANLRPALLDEYGLVTALHTHLKEFSSRYGIEAIFEEPSAPLPRLNNSTEITLLRIAQEALFNVAKHARASQASLALRQEDSTVSLVVQDNGVGVEAGQVGARPGSHGLTIMRERAEAVGGLLTISSEPGGGTTIEVIIPLAANVPDSSLSGSPS